MEIFGVVLVIIGLIAFGCLIATYTEATQVCLGAGYTEATASSPLASLSDYFCIRRVNGSDVVVPITRFLESKE